MSIQTPSANQVGDKCYITLVKNNRHFKFDAIVHAVHFYTGKVKYDLELPFKMGADNKTYATRIYNVDSAFVSKQTKKKKA